MTVKSFYLAPILILIALALVFNSCEAPKYYENVQKDFPAVVRIYTTDRLGSGVIITKEGYVLTSKHVLGDSKSAFVKFNDGGSYIGVLVVSDDARDLAILRLPQNPAGYPFATLGSSAESDSLQVGSPVLVMGYPADNKDNQIMLSTGTICAFPRIDSINFLQSGAKINPGSSGGPMTNSDGDVIGIINSQYTNLKDTCSTFATASSEAQALLDSIASGQLPPAGPAAAPSNPAIPASPCSSVGCLAPDFSLPTADQKELTLSSLKGKKVILAFLSTTCSACLQTMQCLLPIYANWPRDQLEMVFVLSGEQFDDVQRWVNLYQVKCPVVLDSQGKALNQYKPDQEPALYFLTADGHIKIRKYPPIDGCTQQLDALLRQY
ncbi:MAG: trypsin-like peptidase domain-containing protein [Dehalococcoidia bacterium]|jgi:peroxiredoxin/V8-like Glu-specific endopeptidase